MYWQSPRRTPVGGRRQCDDALIFRQRFYTAGLGARTQKLARPGGIPLDGFDLKPGRQIAGKYEVLARLGSGYEGEVYQIVEKTTGIECAAKLFYPERNPKNRTAARYARKLHDLRNCPMVIQYQAQECIQWRRQPVSVLISELVPGPLLSNYIQSLRGKRMRPFQALHLLHALASGLESIHARGHYHGDLHSDNIIVSRVGLEFELRFLDLYEPGGSKRENVAYDIADAIGIFHEALGGAKHYAKHPPQVKAICRGLKRSLIRKRFKNATVLRKHIETLDWLAE